MTDIPDTTTPVVLIVFNRPEPTRRVFAAIAKARPSRLLVIADGPRLDRLGESERCAEVRQIVSRIDWPCKVDTNFAAENMGCRRRVISGLNWVFSLVEEAIILEDDCLPDQSFFQYCTELLERYRENYHVGLIAGFNYEGSFRYPRSYYFSLLVPIWGWATWRRSWEQYDERMEGWPEARRGDLLERLFPNQSVIAYWEGIFDRMYDGTGPNTWDYQWTYTCWSRNWLNILPAKNLVQNIGFGEGATHTTNPHPIAAIPADKMAFPLTHPLEITCWQTRTMKLQKSVFVPSLFRKVKEKMSRTLLRGSSRA
ncbi:glycosyltransferase family 2 protein [Acidobacterium sp. S8]|uniref:glycosyltransferase family 2 protein n=1 Tax=Acidobacterium sp. S8 TaxID=1641854 RepID=UPI00131DC506|nr:glycosyltransferase family 2 protein [Acidobacterium sp. S8]